MELRDRPDLRVYPAVARGTVYVGSWNNHFYAVDAVTGGLDWSYKTGGGVRSSPAVSGRRGLLSFQRWAPVRPGCSHRRRPVDI